MAIQLNSLGVWARTAPQVVGTFPKVGDKGVKASLTKVIVRFDQPMQSASWSWVKKAKRSFPTVTGSPEFDAKGQQVALPVRLEPNQEYEIWINSFHHQNFKNQEGVPAIPFKLVFSTA